MHHIKLWKIFKRKANLLYGSNLLWDIFRIICAMYNIFRASIIKETSYNELNEDAENIISMLERSNENDIADNEVNTKQGWKKTSILALKESCLFS